MFSLVTTYSDPGYSVITPVAATASAGFFGVYCIFMSCMMILMVAGIIFWIMMIIDIVRRDDSEFKSSNERVVWILVVALTSYIGALIYYFAAKRPMDEAKAKKNGGRKS